MAKARKLPPGAWRVQIFDGKNATGKNQYKAFTNLDKKEG